MVVFGHETTLPLSIDQMMPLVQAVVRGTQRAMIVADLPFGSYELRQSKRWHLLFDS
jgi:3-methyl-2-oxobutanoate hydroxymethyltransferase